MNEILQQLMALAQKAADQGIRIDHVEFEWLLLSRLNGDSYAVRNARIRASAGMQIGGGHD